VRVLLAFATLLLASGCATLAPATCETPEFNPPARLTCEAAIAAARGQLATVDGVTALRVDYVGVKCPDNARCMAPNGDFANVIATLAGGEELSVAVSIDDAGVVQAQEPQPFEVIPPIPEG